MLPTRINQNQQYPDILKQFTPEIFTNKLNDNQIAFAQVGTDKVINETNNKTFEPINIRKGRGPLIIYDKRWYFRLVSSKSGDYRRARALMDDYPLNNISKHMVVCFTPDRIPGQNKLFRNMKGEPVRIYGFFDSYLEFFEYMQNFESTDRAFYEIIFGELPQKPHFDIDIDIEEFQGKYPGEDIDMIADMLKNAVITGCIQTLSEEGVNVDIEKDILLYNSHGINKRSYHLVINNKCHDGNKEAKAFAESVMERVRVITNDKYLIFIDMSVYSPRQQFRLVGCRKIGSNRPKVFHEQFWYGDKLYTHRYNEDVTDVTMKKLAIVYESMIGFCSGCIYLPSLVPSNPNNQNKSDFNDYPDLHDDIVNHCLSMLKDKMVTLHETIEQHLGMRIRNICPFSLREIQGNRIILRRDEPSICPICMKEHKAEHPYIFIIGGKVYWDCRRSHIYAEGKKLLLGYLAMSIEDMRSGNNTPGIIDKDEDEDDGEFMFGDYNIGLPTLPPTKDSSKKNSVDNKSDTIKSQNNIPPEQLIQNLPSKLQMIQKEWAKRKYLRREPEDLNGTRRLDTVISQMEWKAGYLNK